MQNKNKTDKKINGINNEKIKNINSTINKYEQYYNLNNKKEKCFKNEQNNEKENYFINNKCNNIEENYFSNKKNDIRKNDFYHEQNNMKENYYINNKCNTIEEKYSNNENIEKKNFYSRENNLEKNYYMQDKNNGIEKNIRGEKMQSENRIKIISINKQIHLISESDKIENEIEVVKKIKSEKENYDVILIDIENEMQNYFSVLLEEIDKIIFLTEANVLQIKKSKMYLEEMIENYKMEKEKINFVCNKIKAETLSFNILKNVLREYNILGKINDVKNSNLLINHNMKNIFLEKEIQRQYQKIGNEILKNKNAKKYYINKIE